MRIGARQAGVQEADEIADQAGAVIAA